MNDVMRPRTVEEREMKEYHLSDAQHEQIEKLAFRLWEERGRPLGSPDDDWFHAEQELIRRSDSASQLPFSSLMMEPREY
jgi:hypothetical protein